MECAGVSIGELIAIILGGAKARSRHGGTACRVSGLRPVLVLVLVYLLILDLNQLEPQGHLRRILQGHNRRRLRRGLDNLAQLSTGDGVVLFHPVRVCGLEYLLQLREKVVVLQLRLKVVADISRLRRQRPRRRWRWRRRPPTLVIVQQLLAAHLVKPRKRSIGLADEERLSRFQVFLPPFIGQRGLELIELAQKLEVPVFCRLAQQTGSGFS